MEISIKVDDKKLVHFTNNAKDELNNQLNEYVDYIIKESKLIEDGEHEEGVNIEITGSIIKRAVKQYKRNPRPKKNKGLIILKIISSLSALFTGMLFDVNGFQANSVKLILFVFVLVITCVTTVLQFVKED